MPPAIQEMNGTSDMSATKKQSPPKSQSPELKRAKRAWRVMKRRCLEPGFKDFPRYGGSGILIAPQWLASFEQFLSDAGLPPTLDHWLGRLDTAAHYVPGNVVWTLRTPQMNRRKYCRKVIVQGQAITPAQAARQSGQPTRNTVLRRWEAGFSLEHPMLAKLYRRSLWLTYQGQTLPLPDWARRIGLPHGTLYQRIRKGMPLERAMTTQRYAINGRTATRKTQP